MSREQEIEAREKAATEVLVKQRRYQGSPPVVPASYEEDLRQLVTVDTPYLLAELKEAREKLEAVRELGEAATELQLVADTPIGKRVIGQRVGRSGEYVQVALKLSEIRRFKKALDRILKGDA